MLVVKRAPCQFARRINHEFCRRDHTVQGHDASLQQEDASTPTKRNVTVTKIDFAELPSVRRDIDGKGVFPLPHWTGGLQYDGRTSIYREDKISADELVKPMKKIRSKRNSKSDVNAELSILNIAPSRSKRTRQTSKQEFDVEPMIKSVKRTRKSKAADGGTEVETVPKSDMLGGVIMENLTKFPHCILLTRVGQFYESYFDQAVEVASLLNIKLTSRPYDKKRIPMCGFPLLHLDKSLKVLVQQNKRFVAMCEEFPRLISGGAKLEFDRRVVRVITPGTLIDESFLNQYENNFLLAISSPTSMSSLKSTEDSLTCSIGLAWIDISTGEFFAKSSNYADLRDELARIGPKEIVVDSILELDAKHPVRLALAEDTVVISYFSPSDDTSPTQFANSTTADDLTATIELDDNLNLPVSFTVRETAAIKLLNKFLFANLLENMPVLASPNREDADGRLQIDAHTIRALEIRDGAAEGTTKGSLLSVIKRTVTTSGTRLLSRWLCSPSTSIKEIQTRQSLVDFLKVRPHFRNDVARVLGDTEDASRIVQKFRLGRGDATDLVAIHATIMTWRVIKDRIELEKSMEQKERGSINECEWANMDALLSRLTDLDKLATRITTSLHHAVADSDTLLSDSVTGKVLGDGIARPYPPPTKGQQLFNPDSDQWSIRPAFSEELTALHARLNMLLSERESLQKTLQNTYGAHTLSLRASPGYGMHVHAQKTKKDAAKLAALSDFVKIAESGSTASFFHQPWALLGGQIADTTTAIRTAEKQAFDILRNEVNAFSTALRRNVRIMDELDVTQGFANLAAEMGFVRPQITNECMYELVNGRHPTVEMGLMTAGRVFTPNSVKLDPTSRLHIITGPNMAGKSTFLRQIALVAILAQTGSFVPADFATIGIVDKLFSRIGAKDDLFRDRSTFMVEMLETAEILQKATAKSLVIMDEVGRGTTAKDGLALAFATIHHLASVNHCRALFATHFHEIADILGYSDSGRGTGVFADVEFFCTDVEETEDGHFAYSHRMRPGVNRDSHGLKVAQLAGMPQSAIDVARRTLAWLKEPTNDDTERKANLAALGRTVTDQQ